LIMAADAISGYIQGLLDGVKFKQMACALDRDSRKEASARFGADVLNRSGLRLVQVIFRRLAPLPLCSGLEARPLPICLVCLESSNRSGVRRSRSAR
jgi:hypothetical protein